MSGRASWWSGNVDTKMGHASPVVRLALALGAIRSIVRVVDRTIPPLTVDWSGSSEDDAGKIRSMSYTDMKGGTIHINPLPLVKGKLSDADALEVTTGFGIHEASHSQESRSRYGALLTKDSDGRDIPAFRPMRVAAWLWNVVEDVRIESVTSRHWPGFAPYFDAVLDYMWADMKDDHEVPTEYGPDLAAKLRVVFLSCRYPEKVRTLFAADPILLAEMAWWESWQADYLADRADVATTIGAALAHLRADHATASELGEETAAEIREHEAGERARAQLDRLIREGIAGVYGVCVTHDGEVVPLDAETAEEVRKLVREELVEHQTIIRAVGARNPPIHVRKPEETTDSRRAYIGRPNADSERLRTALVFRNSAPQYDLKLLKSGAIDDEELYRWGMDDHRVFSERVVEAKPEVFMGLLVDLSGSMSGSKKRTAQQLAQLLVWAVHDQEGIETRVWGHTGDLDDSHASEVFRIWEKGDPLSRLGLVATLPSSDNYDSVAASVVIKTMLDEPQPTKQLIILSDGLPSGSGFGGQPAVNHMRSVIRWANSQGVNVLQIAIDPNLVPSDQEALFGPGNWLPYKDTAGLPRQLSQVMSRFL